jgi:hypothetical protein
VGQVRETAYATHCVSGSIVHGHRTLRLLMAPKKKISHGCMKTWIMEVYIMKLLGIISVSFVITDQLLITFFFAFVRYWRKNGEYNETVHQLFLDFNKAYDSVRREVLYNILF